MATSTVPRSPQQQLVTALHQADAGAFPVAPRVLRRVLRHQFELRGFWSRVPSLHSFAIAREALAPLVAADELGVDDLALLPPIVLLIELPEESELESAALGRSGRQLHRALFHARIHATFSELRSSGIVNVVHIRKRIDQLGQAQFDEAFAVLRQEHRVGPEPDRTDGYIEFVATWLELRYFEPHLLTVWFPSIHDPAHVEKVICEDLDAEAIFNASRLDLGDAAPNDAGEADEVPAGITAPLMPAAGWRRFFAERRFRKRMKSAQAAAAKGNDVRSAVLWRIARSFAPADEIPAIDAALAGAIERLTARLKAALVFGDSDAQVWPLVLSGLIENSTRGFWNSDARLLYDLQKVCLDHEKEVSAVDLLGWCFSFGRKPIKRSLPNQREVLMSKHLRSAARRVPATQLPAALRERLSRLLEAAAHSAEDQLRVRIRPLVRESLEEVGLTPTNVPERVSLRKIVEELVDQVVRRGYLSMGDLRDAISRNSLKLNDLSGPLEFFRGDRLLRSDRRLAVRLDGVYRRGEIYLRWLQALSSAAFGTVTGRFLVQYFAIPFGGAYIILAGLSHLLVKPVESLFETQLRIVHPGTVTGLGVVLLLFLHVERFREAVLAVLRVFWRATRGLLFDFPRWVARLESVRALLRHPWVTTLRRWLIQPALLTGLVWFGLPLFGLETRPGWLGTTPMFLAFWLILNSRAGRDIEEVVTERVEKTWHRIRVHVFVALFDLIMETFKRVVDFVEKILYEVDEFLRFRSGESFVSLLMKGVLGIAWAVVAFVVRFCVTLLIEPQVNPIKHFPVVTVSHKLILPFAFVVGRPFEAFTDPITAKAIGTTIVTCIPGIFGFLVWEFRENWRLYAANRLRNLRPAIIGEHGETMPRLLQPGFHSGTIPKTYARWRRASRSPDRQRRRAGDLRFHHQMKHIEESIRCFIERELIALLEEAKALSEPAPRVGRLDVGLNAVEFELLRGDLPPARVVFVEQSGWLIGEVSAPGWIRLLPVDERLRLESAFAGFYRISGIDLVREQIEACIQPPRPPYDISERGLVMWPGKNYEAEVVYPLWERPIIRPRPRHVADVWSLPKLDAALLVFRENPLSWDDWVALWPETPIGQTDFRWLSPTPILPP